MKAQAPQVEVSRRPDSAPAFVGILSWIFVMLNHRRHVALSGGLPTVMQGDPASRTSDIQYAPNSSRFVRPPSMAMLTLLSPSPMYVWNDSSYAPLVLPLFFALPAWNWLRKRSKSAIPYPPGPKPYPIIENLLDSPLGVPLWEGLAEMAKQYGEMLPSPELLGLTH